MKNETVRQETTELSAINDLLRKQADGLMENREKLMSDNKALEQRQKKLQQDIKKMADSKVVLERNIHAYDEDAKWQLPEPTALMSAKAYREKNALPLVERLKDSVKSLTIKCVNLMDQIKQLKAKAIKQTEDIDFYKNKIRQQYLKLEQLQEKADDFERVKQYVGADKIDTIMTNARELEQIAQSRKRHNRHME